MGFNLGFKGLNTENQKHNFRWVMRWVQANYLYVRFKNPTRRSALVRLLSPRVMQPVIVNVLLGADCPWPKFWIAPDSSKCIEIPCLISQQVCRRTVPSLPRNIMVWNLNRCYRKVFTECLVEQHFFLSVVISAAWLVRYYSPKRVLHGLLDSEEKGTTILRNVGKYLPVDTA